MIKYIGSKRALIPWILQVVERIAAVAEVREVADPFSGSARVAHALKAAGYRVLASDMTTFGAVLAEALVAADRRRHPPERILPLLSELAALPGVEGFITENYCIEARFFHPRNGRRIDAIRARIDALAGGDRTLKAVLLTSLMLAADRVDSTTGVQMAYLKSWAPRAAKDLDLRMPPLLDGEGRALQADALELAPSIDADLVYLDPPYNQHAYISNYHIWETLVLADAPEIYGVARKRIDCRSRKSPFNSKVRAQAAMRELLGALKVPHLLLSFSDEGFFPAATLRKMLTEIPRFGGRVTVLSREHRRFVGARIGIYNPSGERVGRISHTRNREHLFVASTSPLVHDALADLAADPDPDPAVGPRLVPGRG